MMELHEVKYYTGDPCYVIEDNRWNEFCELLWAEQNEDYEAELDWTMNEGTLSEETYKIEVYPSPGGDGCWYFSGGEMGVDAGLLAIVPIECCHENPTGMGILHKSKPTISVDHHEGKVTLNGELDSSWMICNCGSETRANDTWDCEHCYEPQCDDCAGNCCDEGGF